MRQSGIEQPSFGQHLVAGGLLGFQRVVTCFPAQIGGGIGHGDFDESAIVTKSNFVGTDGRDLCFAQDFAAIETEDGEFLPHHGAASLGAEFFKLSLQRLQCVLRLLQLLLGFQQLRLNIGELYQT